MIITEIFTGHKIIAVHVNHLPDHTMYTAACQCVTALWTSEVNSPHPLRHPHQKIMPETYVYIYITSANKKWKSWVIKTYVYES